MKDLELTLEAQDEWGRRITLEEHLDKSCFKECGFTNTKYGFYKNQLISYLEKIHPTLVNFKIVKSNYGIQDLSITDDDTRLFAKEWFEDWDGGNRKLRSFMKFPRKVDFKRGYNIPRGEMPFEHEIEKYKSEETERHYSDSELADLDFSGLNCCPVKCKPRKLKVSWSKLTEVDTKGFGLRIDETLV